MDLPTEPAARNIITPKRHLSNLQVYIYIYIYIVLRISFIINLRFITKNIYFRIKMALPAINR